MRLRRLDLTRYGRFTDYKIDFGEANGADLHIVFGPNESGKTTAFNAYLDLLYGIEKNSAYGFKHAYPTMRIGAALEFGGVAREFVRLKRQTGSLLDANDQPIAEAAIAQELGAVTRASYREMFSLDDETLETGGENISQSKGNLGELLFAATAGLSAIGENLAAVKADYERFYRPQASKIELAELKKRLAELKDERDRLDTSTTEYRRLAATYDDAKSGYGKVDNERTRLMSSISQIQRKLGALPRLTRHRALQANLAEFGDLPEVPAGWATEVATLEASAGTLKYREQQSAEELKRLEGLLAEKPGDALLPKLQGLKSRLSDISLRKDGADKDLPSRRRTQQEQADNLQALVGRLGGEDAEKPERLILSVDVVGRLQELMQERSGHQTKATTAAKELADCEGRLEAAKADLPPEQPDEADTPARKQKLAILKAIAETERKVGHTGAIRVARRTMNDTAAALAERLDELRPWAGDVSTLKALAIPSSAQIDAWRAAITSFDREITKQDGETSRLATERQAVSAEITARTNSGVVTDEIVVEARTKRENAWAELRRQLDVLSAERFEQTMRADDQLTANRLIHVTAAAKQQEAVASLARLTAQQRRAEELGGRGSKGLAAIHDEIAATFGPLLLPFRPETAITDLEAWLNRRSQALQASLAAEKAREGHEELVTRANQARDRLTHALEAVGSAFDSSDLDILLGLADQVLEADRDLEEQRRTVSQIDREQTRRESDAKHANAALEIWQDQWAKLCRGCWLGEKGTIPSTSIVQEILQVLPEFGKILALKGETDDRICKMEEDQRRYATELQAIASELGIGTASIGAETLRLEVDSTLAAVSKRETELSSARTAMDEATTKAGKLNGELETHRNRADEICQKLEVSTLAEAAIRLGKISRKTELEKDIKDERIEILTGMGVETIEAAEAALEGADRDLLQGELGRGNTELGALDAIWRDRYAALTTAAAALDAVGGDDRAALIEAQRRTVLLEIEDGTRRYLSLAAGVIATTRALWLYRDRHRSSMLERASEAFHLVTRGAYLRLAAQPDGNGEVLIAIQADGVSKQASELSKGTRFQLYLALRVAGYGEFAKSRPAVPFIADDIMETFDDNRSEEALRLFAEMSKLGQVIYLTHHAHLREMARQTCPSATFHELPSAS